MKKKVIIGISGGVDSSVSAYLLKEKGYEVIGVTLIQNKEQLYSQDLKDGKKVCEFLGIKHKVIDISEEFKKEVIDYFIREYSRGKTPSPCVVCDEKIKMKKLLEISEEENGDYIATGHYCHLNNTNEFGKTLLELCEDKRKDQSYMLYRVKPEVLEKIIFPLYGLKKEKVREIAEKIGLIVHDKKDSQGICFAKEGYIEFLKNNLGEKIKPGNYVDENRNILGTHMGYQLYTVGQRRGLGIKYPEPIFILEIIPEKNEIVLGKYEKLKRKEILLDEVSLNIDLDEIKKIDVIGRPRFSSNGFLGNIVEKDEKIYFVYKEENYQNSPGQHLVFYYKDLVLGGGRIV